MSVVRTGDRVARRGGRLRGGQQVACVRAGRVKRGESIGRAAVLRRQRAGVRMTSPWRLAAARAPVAQGSGHGHPHARSAGMPQATCQMQAGQQRVARDVTGLINHACGRPHIDAVAIGAQAHLCVARRICAKNAKKKPRMRATSGCRRGSFCDQGLSSVPRRVVSGVASRQRRGARRCA